MDQKKAFFQVLALFLSLIFVFTILLFLNPQKINEFQSSQTGSIVREDFYALGVSAFNQKQYELALVHFNKVTPEDPNYKNTLAKKEEIKKLLLDIKSQAAKEEKKHFQQSPPTPQTRALTGIPILTYHYIGNNPNPQDQARYYLSVTPQNFSEQMNYLSKNGYHPISLDTFAAISKGQGSLPQKPIILTFDDGYVDFYFNAYNILRQYNLPATVFIITDFIDNNSMYLTWSQIQEMKESGLISFGAHTLTHKDLTKLDSKKMSEEISNSRQVLTSKLSQPINFFAYPYGAFNSKVIQEVKQTGFIGAVTTIPGDNHPVSDFFTLHRIAISGKYNLNDFIQKISSY